MATSRVIQTVLKLKDDFSRVLRNARENVERFERQVKLNENRITKSLKNIKKQFKDLAINITKSLASISYKGLQKGLDILKNFSLLGGSLGVASLGAGIFEGMDYETYKVQLETATKDVNKASKLMQDAILFANKTPFETGQVIEATAKFESMGLSAKKWLSITADMAGATSKDMIQAVEAVIDAVASGEFERLKEFGPSKKTLEDLDEQGKVFNNKGQVIDQLALTELLFTEMEKRYKGGAESLSKTTKGMWSTVTGVFKNSMAKIVGVTDDGMVRSGSLLDNLKKIVEKVANKMVEWQQDGTIEKIATKFDNFISKIKTGFSYLKQIIDDIKQKFEQWKQDGTIDNLKDKITTIFSNIINFVPKAIGFISSFIKSLKWILPIIAGIVAGVKTWGIVSNITAIVTDLLAKKQAILNIVAKIFNKTAWSNPWVLVIGLIVGAIVWLIFNFDKVKIVIDEVKQKFLEFKEYVINIYNAFAEKFPLLAKTFEDIFNGVKSIFSGIIDFFTGVFTGNWEQALDGLKNIAEGVFDVIKSIFLAPFRFFATGINWVIEKINSISITLPEWIPVIGGKTFGNFNIPTIPTDIPNFATGTSYHRGGLAEINEGGRGEIVDLPNGSKIIPADKSEKLLNKKSNQINVTVNVYNSNNVDEIINTIAYKLKLALANI